MSFVLMVVVGTVVVVLIAEFFFRWAFFRKFPVRREWFKRAGVLMGTAREQGAPGAVSADVPVDIGVVNEVTSGGVQDDKVATEDIPGERGAIPAVAMSLEEMKRVPISAMVDQLPVKRPLITSIAVLLLRDFITCSVHGDMSVLGDGTEEELRQAFGHLLSQYYEARNDERMKQYLKTVREMRQIELRSALVTTLSRTMKHRYSNEAARVLRELYAGYAFSETSYLDDVKMAEHAEIQQERKYDRLLRQMKVHEAANAEGIKLTPEQRHRAMIASLMDINKVEGVRYDMQTMTVLEYAVAESRKAEYIESLKKQNNG